ncbi:hypothetical protein FE374_13195 [Georgenia yuyongxinii]|uniref:Uncharacterized protein n=1 Tax=Georgenia yuyongxinii TaxID=2589797 RepID=A0A5B8C537_9MICO|nr:hypothetical protein [Georgenia yuyongxinii]QDC25438.1 hypothetical protein FE374_13195 [Georgenia yuyongxinii]
MAGDYADEGDDSAMRDVCELPDGGLVAVGWSDDDVDGTRAAIWRLVEGVWTRGHAGAVGTAFSWCRTGPDGLVIGGSAAGATVTWRSGDGLAVEESGRLPDGVVRHAAHEVEGGLAAAGHLSTPEHEGPVVWLSREGEDWRWARLPSRGAYDGASVHAVGADLLVVFSGATAEQAWLISDVAGVLDGG